MPHANAERRVYRVSPARRFLVTLALVALLLFQVAVAAALMMARDRAIAAVLLATAAGTGVLLWAVGRVRLELLPKGVRWVGFGGAEMRAAWPDVVGLRIDPGRDGLVTDKPIEGRAAARQAAYRNVGSYGTAWYDESQRAAMAERRWIPLDAYSSYLRGGTLLDDITRFAPHLRADGTAGPSSAPSSAPAGRDSLYVLAGSLLVAGVLIAAAVVPRVGAVVIPIVLCFGALLLAVSGARFWRDGARFTGAIQAVGAVLLAVFGVTGLAMALLDGPSKGADAGSSPARHGAAR